MTKRLGEITANQISWQIGISFFGAPISSEARYRKKFVRHLLTVLGAQNPSSWSHKKQEAPKPSFVQLLRRSLLGTCSRNTVSTGRRLVSFGFANELEVLASFATPTVGFGHCCVFITYGPDKD